MPFFNTIKKDYIDSDGPVRFLDGSGLERPIDMPRQALLIMGAFVVVAAIIGGVLLFNILDSVNGSSARTQASVEENLAREVSYDLPVLPSLIQMDDNGIRQVLTDAGFTLYETSEEGDHPAGGFDIVKLPSDVTLEEAGLMYLQGVANLNAGDAARLLNGSWTMSVDRAEYLDMRARYADFASGSIEAALDSAIAAEGFDPASVNDSGEDEVGNVYRAGTIDVNGTVYQWRVSAIDLKSVYDISGLPESAVYVGIRMTE